MDRRLHDYFFQGLFSLENMVNFENGSISSTTTSKCINNAISVWNTVYLNKSVEDRKKVESRKYK